MTEQEKLEKSYKKNALIWLVFAVICAIVYGLAIYWHPFGTPTIYWHVVNTFCSVWSLICSWVYYYRLKKLNKNEKLTEVQ
jgi:hypothetical protein